MKFARSCLLLAMFVSPPAYALFDAQASIGFAGLNYIDDGSTASTGKFKETSLQALPAARSAIFF